MTPLQQAAPVRAVVLSAVPVSASMAAYLEPGAFIVACDAGYRNAETLGVVPDLIVGDFDSAPQPPVRHERTIVLPHVKDDTDTHFAARWLWQHGCREVTFLGALGGQRFEHTVANLHTALFLAENGVQVLLADERSELRILCPGQPIEEQGVFYPLRDAVLTPDYPLGVSNEFTAPQAVLSCRAGHGLVVLSRADTL